MKSVLRAETSWREAMITSNLRRVVLTCAAAGLLACWPVVSRAEVNAQLVGLFHHEAAPACATCPAPALAPAAAVAPPYTANRVVWSPSYGMTSWAPRTRVVAYGTTAYLPVSSYGSCSTCTPYQTSVAYTTYRPFLSWLFRPFQPVTTYYVPAAPACATGCCPTTACYAPSCSVGCETGCSTGCATGSCGGGCDTGCAPSLGCASCGAPAPVTAPYLEQGNPSPSNPPGKTFVEPPAAPKPNGETSPYPGPITPANPATMNEPRLIQPSGPTAARPIRQATYLLPTAVPVRTKTDRVAVEDDLDAGGWRDARD